jgi:hypothetical protein
MRLDLVNAGDAGGPRHTKCRELHFRQTAHTRMDTGDDAAKGRKNTKFNGLFFQKQS